MPQTSSTEDVRIFSWQPPTWFKKPCDAPTWCIKDILQQMEPFLTHLGKIYGKSPLDSHLIGQDLQTKARQAFADLPKLG